MRWPGLAHLLLDDLVLLGLLGQALGGGLQVPQVDQPVQRAPGGRRGAVGSCREKVQGGSARRRCREEVQGGEEERSGSAEERSRAEVQGRKENGGGAKSRCREVQGVGEGGELLLGDDAPLADHGQRVHDRVLRVVLVGLREEEVDHHRPVLRALLLHLGGKGCSTADVPEPPPGATSTRL